MKNLPEPIWTRLEHHDEQLVTSIIVAIVSSDLDKAFYLAGTWWVQGFFWEGVDPSTR